jgi:hypothetical protein
VKSRTGMFLLSLKSRRPIGLLMLLNPDKPKMILATEFTEITEPIIQGGSIDDRSL